MIKHNIEAALANGLDETQLVETLRCTYLELRQFCVLHDINLDYSFISEGLVAEIFDNKDWKAPKLASRYRLSLPVMQRILLSNYPLSVKRPEINKKSLEDLVAARYSVKEIAKKLDTSVYYVRRALAAEGLQIQRGKLTAAQYDEIVQDLLHGLTPQVELAKQYGVDPSMISYIKAQAMAIPERKKYVKADPELVVKLLDNGYSQESVAKQLGIAQATVSRLYKDNK